MSPVAEAQKLLIEAVGHVPAGTYLKTIFPSVANSLGVTVRRVETIWQGKARRIDAFEVKRIEALLARKKQNVSEIRNANRYEAVAAELEAANPDLHRAEIARYRGLARALRGAAGDGQVAQ